MPKESLMNGASAGRSPENSTTIELRSNLSVNGGIGIGVQSN